MDPLDKRHGEYAGAVAHWFDGERPCDDCARAETRYRKRRKLRHLQGDPPMVPSLGPLRRWHALQALGHTHAEIAAEAGVTLNTLRAMDYHGSELIRSSTAAAIGRAFEELCMVVPTRPHSKRIRFHARRKGYWPPLAWNDIDDPNEQPSRGIRIGFQEDKLIDEAAVVRLLSGETVARCSRADKVEALRRWVARGGSARSFEDLHRWKQGRYRWWRAEDQYRDDEGDAA